MQTNLHFASGQQLERSSTKPRHRNILLDYLFLEESTPNAAEVRQVVEVFANLKTVEGQCLRGEDETTHSSHHSNVVRLQMDENKSEYIGWKLGSSCVWHGLITILRLLLNHRVKRCWPRLQSALKISVFILYDF